MFSKIKDTYHHFFLKNSFEEGIRYFEARKLTDCPSLSDYIYNRLFLTRLYIYSGRFNFARKIFEELREKIPIPKDILVEEFANTIDLEISYYEGKYDDCEELLKNNSEFFEIDRLVVDAKVNWKKGSIYEAISGYFRALLKFSIDDNIESYYEGRILNLLGLCFVSLKNYSMGEKILKIALEKTKSSLSPNHCYIGLCEADLARCLLKSEQNELDAKSYLEKSEQKLELKDNKTGRFEAIMLKNRARLSWRNEKYEEAVNLYREELKIRKEI
ncbi:MAG: tetratricopeptide repeat protein, partial [Bacteroidota bacterium]